MSLMRNLLDVCVCVVGIVCWLLLLLLCVQVDNSIVGTDEFSLLIGLN